MRIALGILSLLVGIMLLVAGSSDGLAPGGWVIALCTLIGGAFAFRRSGVTIFMYFAMWGLGILVAFGEGEDFIGGAMVVSFISIVGLLFAVAAYVEQGRANKKRA